MATTRREQEGIMSVLDREHPWPWLIFADVCFFLSGLAIGYGLWHG